MEQENKKDNYEYVNHPSHYEQYGMDVIDMARKIWGDKIILGFAIVSAFKYRMRMGNKPNEPMDRDLKKEEFYLKLAKETMTKLGINSTDELDLSVGIKIIGLSNTDDGVSRINPIDVNGVVYDNPPQITLTSTDSRYNGIYTLTPVDKKKEVITD